MLRWKQTKESPKKAQSKPPAIRATTLSELVGRVCVAKGAPRHIVWPVIEEFIDQIVDSLDEGQDVKLRRLGTLRWISYSGRSAGGVVYAAGKRLKLVPAIRIRGLR